MMTINEKKILRFLLANFDKDHSINEIAKQSGLAPNGAYEMLRKFEEKGVLLPKKIANLKSYKVNFDSIEAIKLLELVLIPDYKESKINYRYNDLRPLKDITKLCIIFGSYITKKEKPNDIDAIFVIKKSDYNKYNQALEKVKMIMPFKLHDVIQTKADLSKNIRKKDKILINAISEGAVLWGHEFLIEVIKNAAQR
ncbi:MAG: winged helix-turn-helix transcriptional regulator [Candidatus Woesearchaeota archaeon]